MKEVINIYKKHKSTVDDFIITMIKNLPRNYIDNADMILNNHPNIQLLYAVDENYKQISPIICKKRSEKNNIGSDKEHYFAKVAFNNDNFYISNPYIHYRTGKASLSVVHKLDNIYYVFDINLIGLLEELKLIEYNSIYDKIKRAVYFFGALILVLVSITLILYGAYIFGKILLFDNEHDLLHSIFQSIISITLGIAIYDLASQIFEHEVLFISLQKEEDRQYKILGKFLISIIIALSIETLMVVFKIVLGDYSKMLSAFWLLLGTTLMIAGLAFFYKTIRQSSCKEED
ncbi:MAG: hypothetical protein IE880_07465 [Epsilonproteobacteria bacterium]|nr:hypothetical protein [Campylobacterota bacterium]